jgi:hypothetical protein
MTTSGRSHTDPAERTPEERARWALRRACNGWRRDRQCRSNGLVLEQPHLGCIRAQEEHDHILNHEPADEKRS